MKLSRVNLVLLASTALLCAVPPAGARAAEAPPCGTAASMPMGDCPGRQGPSAGHGPGAKGSSMGGAMGGAMGGTKGGPMGSPMGGGGQPMMSLMTPAEREEHHRRVASFHSWEECRAYVDDLRQRLAARARERGVKSPDAPMHDPCSGLLRLKP